MLIMFGTMGCLGATFACKKAEPPSSEATAEKEHSEAPVDSSVSPAETEPTAKVKAISLGPIEPTAGDAQETSAPDTDRETPDRTIDALEQDVLAKWERVRSLTATVMTHTQERVDGGMMWMDGLGSCEFKRKGDKLLIRLDQSNTAGYDRGAQRQKSESQVLTISDGDFVYVLTEFPGQKQAEKHLPQAFEDLHLGGQRVFDKLRQHYVLKCLPDAMFDNHPVYSISGEAKDGGPGILYFFDPETGVIVRMRFEDRSKEFYRTITIIDLQINPELPDERFVFIPPEGVEIVDRTASGNP
jgi:outer membrane lipoprotein-sorting protein